MLLYQKLSTKKFDRLKKNHYIYINQRYGNTKTRNNSTPKVWGSFK